ncbi:hypothetical protein KC332_g13870 [Hortaea werneckii]|nr:hypothetical protein KC350_g8103 [Hortaea werneckii]KAI6982080.1 hypothetical protein KC329_g9036 [Hortaea werneckii]KAI7022692.1 hypothetical protein KC366_g12927 [Hortaea werneckii]KAI7061324.1 hypothetical protein KC327_g14154 [Hortaea werneckii]KAI7129994.1 hypothetical protein KC337_g7237 [Hortaea werneckii]
MTLPVVDERSRIRIGLLKQSRFFTSHQSSINVKRDYKDSDRFPQEELDRGLTAVHHPGMEDSTQLFYGPTSNFAFIQQIHRGVLLKAAEKQASNVLDQFVQRSIFFGTPSRIDLTTGSLNDVSYADALALITNYNTTTHNLLPFFAEGELEQLVRELYSVEPLSAQPSQKRAITLAVLALGALSTPRTSVAEAFYAQAKVCAAPFEDAVTLTMIQFSLLCADYQCNLGRPNSAYMQLGAACRRAFAFGLHKEGATSRLREDEFKKRRVTMWCLYFYERWIALSLGRKSSLQIADISSGPLDDQSLVSCLARMANIVERDVGSMYEGGPHTLQELYHAADKAHHNLREFGETLRIGSRNMFPSLPPACDNIATLQFHNLYYLSILLIFRPFLIAESALRTKSSSAPGEMWLRQACRCAIDAAQDYLVFASGLLKSSDICKRPRYTTFFIESSCAVLLHDVLSHPSKYAYHLEYIQLATETLESMVHDDPVLNAQRSIRRILQAVERAISAPSLSSSETNPSEPASSTATNPQPTSNPLGPSFPNPYGLGTSVQFPSLQPQAHPTSEDLIYLSDRSTSAGIYGNVNAMAAQQGGGGSQATMPNPSSSAAAAGTGAGVGAGAAGGIAAPDAQNFFDFDVLATDLYSFFPLDLSAQGI